MESLCDESNALAVEELSDSFPRQRVIQISYSCNPTASMESRLGWNRAVAAARNYDTWVICGEQNREEIEAYRAIREMPNGLVLCYLPIDEVAGRWLRKSSIHYGGYHQWHISAYRLAQQLHEQHPFDLAHQVGFCGFREPGYLWRLDVPFIWGPVGGTHCTPRGYASVLGPVNCLIESSRALINHFHLRYRKRVHQAAKKASTVFAANTTTQHDLSKYVGIETTLQLETGLEGIPQDTPTKPIDQDELRILWAGRFQPWKALPLLIHALKNLDSKIQYRVRIIGYQKDEVYCRRLARQLGVDSFIEWIGWPPYQETFQHYRWADVFAFTSLRDTSGTGLLEAIAHGCPIIGMNHQGAADIMTPESSIPISVSNASQTICDFHDAFVSLAGDRRRLCRMSEAAKERSKKYLWANLNEAMQKHYVEALETERIQSTETVSESKSIASTQSTLEGRRRTIAKTVLSLVDQAISSCTNFLTVVLVARYCTPTDVGVFSLVMTIVFLGRSLQERAISAPFVVFVHQRSKKGAQALLGSSLVHLCGFSLLLSLLCCAFPAFAYIRDDQSLLRASLALVFLMPFLLCRDHLRAVSYACFRIDAALIVDVVTLVVQLGGLWIILSQGITEIAWIIVAMGFACLIACLAWLVHRPLKFTVKNFSQIWQDWKTSWAYASWLVIARAFGTASRFLMPWLVVYFLNEAAAGKLATCSNLAGLSMMFLIGANNFAQPRAIHAFNVGGYARLLRVLTQTASLFLVCLGSLFLFLMYAGGFLMNAIYGAEYADTGAVVAILGANVLMVGLAIVGSNGLAALKRPIGNLWAEAATLITTLFAAWILIPQSGINGAAWAMLVGNTIGAVVMLAAFRKYARTETTVPNIRLGESLC